MYVCVRACPCAHVYVCVCVCVHTLPSVVALLNLVNRGSHHPTNQLVNNDDKDDKQNDDIHFRSDTSLHRQQIVTTKIIHICETLNSTSTILVNLTQF